MQVIIYGKDHCPQCDKTKMLCQLKALDYRYHLVGSEISIADLQAKVGHAATSLPQVFLTREGTTSYVGGYRELVQALA